MEKSSSPDFDENFEALLSWLDPDRERAGEKYEMIREQLINMFAWRQVQNPEDLADKTIDRVMQRVREVRKTYSGDPSLYFFGVAKKVLLESYRQASIQWSFDAEGLNHRTGTTEDNEQVYECLERCVLKLAPGRRDLLFAYYEGSGQTRIAARRALAAKLDLTASALRMVVYRNLKTLQACIKKCMQSRSEGPTKVQVR